MCRSAMVGGSSRRRTRLSATTRDVRRSSAVAPVDPRENGTRASSAQNAEAQVGDASFSFEDSDALQLALLDAEVLEQTAAVAEQHGDEVDLELVEEPECEGALRDAC